MSGFGRILLVDDDEVFCEAICQTLRHAGFEVALASHFNGALEYLESKHPVDLLLIDIVMPNSVNGFALSAMARLRRPELKVLYLTGYDIADFKHLASGPILRKPIDEMVLINTIACTLAEGGRSEDMSYPIS